MSYKVYPLDNLSPIEWSQAAWRLEGESVTLDCDHELVHEVLLAHLPKQGIILDAGCGTAKWPMYLRRLGYRVVGIHISHDACAIAKRIDPGVDLVAADTRRLALRDHRSTPSCRSAWSSTRRPARSRGCASCTASSDRAGC